MVRLHLERDPEEENSPLLERLDDGQELLLEGSVSSAGLSFRDKYVTGFQAGRRYVSCSSRKAA